MDPRVCALRRAAAGTTGDSLGFLAAPFALGAEALGGEALGAEALAERVAFPRRGSMAGTLCYSKAGFTSGKGWEKRNQKSQLEMKLKYLAGRERMRQRSTHGRCPHTGGSCGATPPPRRGGPPTALTCTSSPPSKPTAWEPLKTKPGGSGK